MQLNKAACTNYDTIPPLKIKGRPTVAIRVIQLIRELESSRNQIGEILSDPHASNHLQIGGGGEYYLQVEMKVN